MDASRAGNGRIFDLLGQPWRILRVDPTATNQQIHDAYSRAQQNPMSAPAALVFARNALLDPNRRLAYEVTYPLDCPVSEVESFFAALSSENSIEEILNFSDQLWPLARANFVAHIASHRAADATILYALLESHAAMDARDVYARLKASRATAGLPAPSWISVNERLSELLHIHTGAAFVGYDTIQDAVEPVLECTRQTLANGERHLIEVMGSLLGPYRRAIGPLQVDVVEQIETACRAVQQAPDDPSRLDELLGAVRGWMSLSRPLLLWDAQQTNFEPGFETPVDQLRLLVANLTENEHYELAIKITNGTQDLFRAVPTTIEKLAEDARLVSSLSQYANVKQLQDTIDGIEAYPDPLIAAVEKDGFGQTCLEPAKRLWEVFVQATNATRATSASELPWQMMQDFAKHLSNQPEAAAAVTSLINGLIEYGARVSGPPRIMRALRDNLSFMKSFMGVEPAPETKETVYAPARDTFFSKIFGRFQLRSPRLDMEPDSKRKHLTRLAGLAIIALALLGGAAFYVNFDKVRSFWSKHRVEAVSQPDTPPLGAETKPPVGTGQHLAVDGVRYCHFQQERLRIIKQEVRGPDDARAYNLLIVDYNSRCSDYFYQDNDLKLVLAEVSAKKDLLAADAKRIMSTLPGHMAEGSTKN